MGGADPASNSRLRDVVAKAKAANIPNDNITRSIKKASGELSSINYETMLYEGYGPGGSAVIVECLTDNKNRTVGEVRHVFDKYGGAMGTSGCVSFMFETKGVLIAEKTDKSDDDETMMTVLDAGAADFSVEGDVYEVLTDPGELSKVRETLEKQGIVFLSSGVERIPASYVTLDADAREKFDVMIEKMEELDDVQNVFSNVD
jgi:YebC/PmpR family DNA-binding regulatory protein